MYDCGCVVKEHGYYGRPDYKSRNTLSLHSWHLLLWSNFGAFCVALLTQPKAHEQIKGTLHYNCNIYHCQHMFTSACVNTI